MGWLIYASLLAVAGFLQMSVGPRLEIPSAQGEYLFLIAFQAAQRCPRAGIMPAFFFAGLLRDFFLSGRLGAGALLYLLAGAVFWFLRDKVEGHHVILRGMFVLLALSCALPLLPLLEGAGLSWDGCVAGWRDALYTALISPLAALMPGFLLLPKKRSY